MIINYFIANILVTAYLEKEISKRTDFNPNAYRAISLMFGSVAAAVTFINSLIKLAKGGRSNE